MRMTVTRSEFVPNTSDMQTYFIGFPSPRYCISWLAALRICTGGTVVITYELVIMQNTIWLTNKRHMLTTLLPKYMHILCIIYFHYVLYESIWHPRIIF